LTVELPTAQGWVRPVNEVSLQIGAGECLGLVGESGSGKTMLSLALMGLLPVGGRVNGEVSLVEGEARADNKKIQNQDSPDRIGATATTRKNLTTLTEAEWRAVRGQQIAMIFQEPMTSLNPVMRVGQQIEEAIRAHQPAHQSKMSKATLRERVITAMRQAALNEPERRAEQYPHQLSGGLRQRAMIAMALASGPLLLIADEPTTALDVTVQKEILQLLQKLRRELRLGLLFITHDLGVVAQVADRVAVMYAGRIVEEGSAAQVLATPKHPYTQGLLGASPRLERGKLTPIPGSVPQLTQLPPGCAFEPRCAVRRSDCCVVVPELRKASPQQAARCVLI